MLGNKQNKSLQIHAELREQVSEPKDDASSQIVFTRVISDMSEIPPHQIAQQRINSSI